MNDLIAKVMESLRGTSAGTKLVAVLGGVSFLVIIGLAAVVSNRPDYQLLFTNLDDHDVGSVGKALADAGFRFRTTSPPAPFSVYVDESEHASAMAAVYSASALDKPLMGITSESGVASVFNSADERRQGVRKREWQEMEAMLKSLRFVNAAHVRTSPGSTNVFSRETARTTASVTLTTSSVLTAAQMDTVARIVSNGLGVRREDVVISDNELRTIFDGSEDASGGFSAKDAREFEDTHDERLAARANEVLERALGPGKAYVLVTSEWNYEQSTQHIETSSGDSVKLEEMKSETQRPRGSADSGGVAGITSNIPEGSSSKQGAAPQPQFETMSDQTTKYKPMLSTEERVSTVPVIKRLSIAFYVDEAALEGQSLTMLEDSVKASVGFVPDRDLFQAAPLAFFVPEAPVVAPEAEVASEPNPMTETLLRRGVEIVSALVFLVLLLKTLKNSGSGKDTAPAPIDDEIDPELLARASVDELLRSDPDKVSEILSSWAREEELAGAK